MPDSRLRLAAHQGHEELGHVVWVATLQTLEGQAAVGVEDDTRRSLGRLGV